MKRTLLVLSLASILAGPALAERVQPLDPHIRVLAYDPDQVVRLTGHMGFQTMLEFAGDERIENVSIGDAMGWQVTPNKRANLLFLKPVDQAPATNMTVVTDQRRYVFELAVAKPKASSADAAYVVRFRYPQAAPVAVAAKPAPTAPVARNAAYGLIGSEALRPTRVFDDGAATYFAWAPQADLPAIYVVGADGVEGLANAVVKDGYVVVDQLAPRFVLRSGKTTATLTNGGYAPSMEKAPMSADLDPRQSPDVVQDLASADAQARPVVARGAGVSNIAILAGFGVLGLGLFAWMASHRADAHPRPQRVEAAIVATPAAAPAPAAAPVAKGPLYAVPGPQFTVDNSAPVAQPLPPMSAMAVAVPADLAARRRAPALVVDFGGTERPAQLIKTSAETPAAAKPDGLSADERFADRIGGLDETTPAKAVAMANLDAVVPQGAVIPAVMETAINSDLPGLARAMVTRDVKSFDGSTVLIPRGSRVIGQYKSGVALGASRVFVIWTRVIRPDGVSIQIGSPAADPLGRGGLEGKVDRHFFTRYGGSILMSVLNAGVAAVSNVRTNSQIYIGSAQEAVNAASAVKPTTTSPTIQTPQGAPVTIFVARDLDFSSVRNPS